MLIGALRQFDGILPAYHMNKEHWISVILDKVDDGQIMALIEDSFYLTQ
jgi:predicted DNA-binding protein (MmcQ/YjbR family)